MYMKWFMAMECSCSLNEVAVVAGGQVAFKFGKAHNLDKSGLYRPSGQLFSVISLHNQIRRGTICNV